MRKGTKLLLTAVAASALLSLAVSSASATHLQINNWEKGFRLVWSSASPLILSASVGEIRCSLTLEGTWHRHTFAKVSGSLIGYVTRAAFRGETCTGATAIVLTESLPWHVRYDSFSGTLPEFRAVKLQLVGAAFAIRPSGFLCLARTEARQPAKGVATVEGGGGVTSFAAEAGSAISLTEGGGICLFGGSVSFAGTAAATVLGETTKIVVRLI